MPEDAKTSRISGFYKLTLEERLRHVAAFGELTPTEMDVLRGTDLDRLAQADKMIENVAGLFHLPAAFAANFRIDGTDRIIPMVIEEASVVAAASHAAKLLRGQEGITTHATAPLMIGQIQLCDVGDMDAARAALAQAADRLVALANDGQPRLVARGGGARELTVRSFEETAIGPMLVVHLLVDVCDAMGANLVNGMVETLAPECEELSGGQAYLRILSNLADRRLVTANGRVPIADLARPVLGFSGEEVADRVVRASVFAEVDPYRATTHNKGIMNGVDAFLLATGQDWRAVEAGAHAYASLDGGYSGLAKWHREGDELVGTITLPMQVGVVGGVVRVHPVVQVLLKVLGVDSANGVARVGAAVGLAQNLAAILALATEGIQRGHMSLHARNIAAAAGAKGHEIDRIVAEMIQRRTISQDAARSILDETKRETGAGNPPLTMDAIQEQRDRYWPQIRSLLDEVVDRDAREGSLEAMVRYQLDTGGKRLRAIIPLVVYEAFGADAEQAVPLAAALEMLHNATLIHDDAEERVRTRRGRDTLWVRFGLDQAINCGDGMVYMALECLGHLPHGPDRTRRLDRLLVRRMIGVTQAQVEAHRRDRPVDTWLDLTRDRTGGLFALAIAGSAVLAGASPEDVERLETVGAHLGVIFQVQDELLDLIGDKRGSGRGSAIADGKMGLLVAHCLHVAPEDDAEILRRILRKPRRDTSADDIDVAAGLLETHGSLKYAVDLIQEQQAQVATLAADLAQPGLEGLLRAMTDILLAPLLSRLPD